MDLINLHIWARVEVSLNKKSYRYVLSVMDAFSWFVWLRAVIEKSSEVISDELENIYLEHGPPCVIQSDQGGEFKGAVKRLCHRMNIKLIYSRSLPSTITREG